MHIFTVWNILAVIATISLIFNFTRSRKTAWVAFAMGVFISGITALINICKNEPVHWPLIKKMIIASVLLGVVVELASIERKNKD